MKRSDAALRAAPTLLAAGMAVGLAAVLALTASACRAARPNLAPRPDALGFPMMETGLLPFEGTANRPLCARYGEAFFATSEGSLYDVDVLSRRVLWMFKADAGVPVAPELGENSLVIRDERNAIYVLDPAGGRLTFRTAAAGDVTTAVRSRGGRLYFGCGAGRITALDLGSGRPAWEFEAGTAVRSGPVFSGNVVVFGTEDGRLVALDGSGRPAWTFAARGAIRSDPAVDDGGIFFGTADRYFYGLAAATGKKRWMFRLAGAPVGSPVVSGRRLVFAASDSVVYCLSARSGEILWWQGVASRAIHALSVADGLVLVSAFSPDIAGYDLRNGRPAGACRAEADLQAGALWVTPYLVLIEPDPVTGGQRMVFLKRDRRPVQTLGQTNPVRR